MLLLSRPASLTENLTESFAKRFTILLSNAISPRRLDAYHPTLCLDIFAH